MRRDCWPACSICHELASEHKETLQIKGSKAVLRMVHVGAVFSGLNRLSCEQVNVWQMA